MDKQIVKSNHVIEAGYRLTLNEQRIILLCIQQISKGQAITPTTGFNIRANEFIEVFGVNQKKAYTELKDVSETLFNRFLTIYKPDPEEPKLESTRTRWITAIDYIPSEGRVKLYFAHKVIPYISMLESGFTRYNLEYVAHMNSIYGIRFYELFKCWLMGDRSKVKTIKLEELKSLLGLKDDNGIYQYPSIKDFKQYVLDKGLGDVNQHTDIQAEYEQKKAGRKIDSLEFTLRLKPESATPKQTIELAPKPAQNAKSKAVAPDSETIDKPMSKAQANAELEGLKRMAALAGVPLESLLPKTKGATKTENI